MKGEALIYRYPDIIPKPKKRPRVIFLGGGTLFQKNPVTVLKRHKPAVKLANSLKLVPVTSYFKKKVQLSSKMDFRKFV